VTPEIPIQQHILNLPPIVAGDSHRPVEQIPS
jgi:hypothetical protein